MKILIVEDSEKLSRALHNGLKNSGYIVDLVDNGVHAIHCMEQNNYEVIVLDIMMPKLDGYGVLDWMRAKKTSSKVIILSAKDTVQERVKGLELGAHDYLIKPFAFEELLARIKVQFREFYKSTSVIQIDEYSLDIDNKVLKLNGKDVQLTVSEYNLIEFLCLRQSKAFTKYVLTNQLYDINSDVNPNVIEVMVSNIRGKLKKMSPNKSLIQNRRGFGYFVEPTN